MSRRTSERRRSLSRAEKVAIPVIIILAVWLVYSISQPSNPISAQQGPSSPTVVSQPSGAPDFTLPVVGSSGLTGQSVTLSLFRGKVVFLEFMEPWCTHCQTMAPSLENLYKQYGDNVAFITIAGPWNGATADDTAKFIRDYGSSWVYLYDSAGTVMNAYRVTATPTFVVIGKDGSVLTAMVGEQTYEGLASVLSQYGS